MAISPDPPARSARLVREDSLPFPVLADPGWRVARSWGVVDRRRARIQPATFVVCPGGRVAWRHILGRTGSRPTLAEILRAVLRCR